MSKVTPLDTPFSKQRADDVTTYDASDIWTPVGAFGRRYNPDELVQKRGLRIYGEMLNDEQVKAVCEFKMNAILSRGWEFQFDEECELSDEDKLERIKLMKLILKRMRGSFFDALDAIASGREFGFSVSEKIYGTVQYKGKSYVGLNKILSRNPESFEFFTDDFGEIVRLEQRTNTMARQVIVDLDRIIHYVHKPKWDCVYGRSDLRAAYRGWYCKDTIIKLWLLYIEKFGGGIAVAKKTGDTAPAAGSSAGNSLENAMRNIRALNSIILPHGVDMELHFPGPGDVYEKAVTHFDLAIAKALLVPNLLGLSHTGQTGAFAQSQTQLEAFYWTLLMDANRLADTVNEQLFRDLGDQNWGDGEYPVFCFKPASMEHIKWIVTTWDTLVKSGAVLNTEEDEKFLRKLLEMPIRLADTPPLVNPMEERKMALEEETAKQMADIQQQAANEPDPRVAAIMNEILERVRASDSAHSIVVNNQVPSAAPVQEPVKPAADPLPEVHFHGPIINCTSEMARRASGRVSFAVINKRTEDMSVQLADEYANALARAVKRAIGDDEVMAQLLDSDTTDVGTFDLAPTDIGKLKSISANLLKRGWQLGMEHAKNEIDKATATSNPSLPYARLSFAALRDRAAGYFESQSFRMAGDASNKAKKIIQQELQNGVKFGKSVAEVRGNIWYRLVGAGMTKRQIALGLETDAAVTKVLDDLWVDTVEEATAYLNTLVRTNMFEALNEARYQEFTDPALKDFVVGLQYAGVLDSAQTEICNELSTEGPDGDGVIYSVDSPLWETYRPPNHFNCRSVLVPVTTADGWDGEESEEPIEEPAEGFK